jgi:hypothetical protein
MKCVSDRPERAQNNMSIAFPKPDHLPCPTCGASLAVGGDSAAHVCDDQRRLDYRIIELRGDIERFPADLAEWLETPSGRFAQWLAERERRIG